MPLADALFMLENNLCHEYALSPFEVERERFRDVIGLYADWIHMKESEGNEGKPAAQSTRPKRVPAGDDWF